MSTNKPLTTDVPAIRPSSGVLRTVTAIVQQRYSYDKTTKVRTPIENEVMTGKSGVRFLPLNIVVSDIVKTRTGLKSTTEKMKATIFGDTIDALVGNVKVGTKVKMVGYGEQRTYTNSDGTLGTSYELRCDGNWEVLR
jgi:hypothetical protein